MSRPLVYALPLLTVACHGAAPAGPSLVGRASEALVSPPVDLGDHPAARDPVGAGAAAVAFGAGEYLVVWERGTADYRAARVSAAGTLLDATEIHLAPDSLVSAGLVAGFDGTNFRVLWSAPGGQYTVKAETTRVSPAGAVLDTPVVLAPILDQSGFTGACSTNGCVLASEIAPTNGDPNSLEIERVDASGKARDSAPLAVQGSTGMRDGVGVITTSSGYRLVWTDSNGTLESIELDATGAFVGSPRAANAKATTDTPLYFAIAASDSGLLVIEHTIPLIDTTCYSYRLGLDGSALDGSATKYPSEQSCSLVASNGTDFLVADLVGGKLPAVSVSSNGALGSVVSNTIPYSPLEQPAAIASDGKQYLEVGSAQSGVQAYLLDAQGKLIGSPVDIALVPASVSDPSVASNGASMLVVWSDNRVTGTNGVYGTRIGLDGTVLQKGIAVAPAAGVNPAAGAPGVAAAGSKYLVAWAAGNSGIGAAQVNGDGTVATPVKVTMSGTDFTPAVASDGAGYMLAWTDSQNLVSDVYTARIDGTGSILDAGGVKLATGSTSLNDGVLPRIAWSGQSYAVAWRRRIPKPSDYQYDVQVAFVSNTGTTSTAAQTVSSGQTDVDDVDVACGGGTCLAVWTSGGGVWMRRYGASGSPMGAALAVSGAHDSPRVVWDGAVFQLVSHDAGDYVARTVAPDGTVGSMLTTLFSQGDAGAPMSYALASNGAGINYAAESTQKGTTTFGIRFTDDAVVPPVGMGGAASGGGSSAAGEGGGGSSSGGAAASGGTGSARGGASGSAVIAGGSGAGTPAGAGGSAATSHGAVDSGAAATGANNGGSHDDSGCGCRQAGTSAGGGAAYAAGIIAAFVGMRRGRRQRRSRNKG